MSKQFGQNFLLPSPIRNRIVDALGCEAGQDVWEIGPGLGAITSLMLERGVHVTAFEIDKGFCQVLKTQAFGDEDGFTLVEGDFLKTWEKVRAQKGAPDRICGNLPYNVGSICIARLLEKQCLPSTMVYTVQKEVAERLTASDGDKNRSTLTLLADIDYETRILFTIGGASFYPPPDVTSAVIGMYRRPEPLVGPELRPHYLMLLKDAFSHRRKTIKNNLVQGEVCARYGREGVEALFNIAGISPQERAENLKFSQLKKLAEAIEDLSQHTD